MRPVLQDQRLGIIAPVATAVQRGWFRQTITLRASRVHLVLLRRRTRQAAKIVPRAHFHSKLLISVKIVLGERLQIQPDQHHVVYVTRALPQPPQERYLVSTACNKLKDRKSNLYLIKV